MIEKLLTDIENEIKHNYTLKQQLIYKEEKLINMQLDRLAEIDFKKLYINTQKGKISYINKTTEECGILHKDIKLLKAEIEKSVYKIDLLKYHLEWALKQD